jgi:YidC/Oxa1 family membrane protein insertase
MIVGGILTPIEDVLTEVLKWFHTSIGLTWAWSIVALTVAVRILLVPIVIRQIHSMQNLQAHAPEMKEIQQRWKHDKQRQNEELMKFYRENKINPASSCLPIVAQIPIFLSLYYVLRDFEKEIFKPLQDADPGYSATLEWLNLVSITDNVRNGWGPLLVVIYVVSQFTSSWYMTATTQGFQRYLILGLPILFAPFVLVYNFPAGLMIYWLTTNLWTTGQGFMTRRLMPKPPEPEKRTSRAPSKAAAAADEAARAPKAAAAKGKTPARSSKPAVAGPPRRVRRKRGGGGGRR